MKRLLLLLGLLFAFGLCAHAQSGNALIIRFPGAPSGSCAFIQLGINGANGDFYDCDNGTWNLVSGGGGGGCTTSGSAGQILVDDGAGGCTSSTPTISGSTITATLSGNASTATALAANPTDCVANQFANAIAANGNLTCAQVAFSDLSGTASDAQIPDLNTLSTGLTASRCVETDGSGLLVSAAALCGTGSGMSIGGTVTSGTAGSVLFVNAGPVLAQDNANLYFDDSANLLQVGARTGFSGSPVFATTITESIGALNSATKHYALYILNESNVATTVPTGILSQAVITHTSSTMSRASAVAAQSYQYGVGGTITNFEALFAYAEVNGGTSTNSHGVRSEVFVTGGTTTLGRAVEGYVEVSSGTVVTGIASVAALAPVVSGGTVPLAIGVEILDSNACGASTCYNLYSYGTSALNRIEGRLDVDTIFRVPTAAGATVTTNGRIAYDTTADMLHAAQGGADAYLPQATITPTNGHCVNWVVSGSQYKLGSAGAACGTGGGITIGTTTITSGTNTRVLYNNSGVVGEYVISGSGNVAMTTSPTFTTPTLGAASATSINGLTITSSTGTLTITNGKTLSVSNTLTFTGTDSSSVAFGAGGTVLYSITYRHNVLSGSATTPDNSGNALFQPYPILATNDFWQHLVAAYLDTSTKDCIYSTYTVPGVASGTFTSVTYNIYWTSTATSGNVVWDIDDRDISGTASFDQSTAQHTLTATTAAPGSANGRVTSTMTSTAGDYAPGDTVEVRVCRDGASSDTMAAIAQIHLAEVVFVAP